MQRQKINILFELDGTVGAEVPVPRRQVILDNIRVGICEGGKCEG